MDVDGGSPSLDKGGLGVDVDDDLAVDVDGGPAELG